MRICPTRIRRNTAPNHGCDECVASRRRRLSLLVKIEGDPLNKGDSSMMEDIKIAGQQEGLQAKQSRRSDQPDDGDSH